MKDIGFAENNAAKYGQKKEDLISLVEKNIGPVLASNICLFTALKYKTRMANGKGRLSDEEKLNDYLCRYKELCLKYDFLEMSLETFEFIVKYGIDPNK